MAKKFKFRRALSVPPSGELTFAQEQALTEQLLSAYSFDSLSSIQAYPASPLVPMKYVWSDTLQSECNSAGLGTRYSLSTARGSTEGNAVCEVMNGVCRYPLINNSIFHSAGGGTGSLQISFSWSGNTLQPEHRPWFNGRKRGL
jgi:hypothetical protein